MDTEPRYSLTDLARVSGVSTRTVRYYIAQGLLPGANDPGPAAWYDDRHLARLRLARELQRQHLPLSEIRTRLGALSDAEVGELLEAPTAPSQVSESALDYVRSVLGGAPGGITGSARRTESPAMPATPPPAFARTPAALGSTSLQLQRAAFTPTPEPPPAPTTPTRSQWDRIAITPDIELHVRRPLGRLDNKLVDRLITIARQVLKEEQP